MIGTPAVVSPATWVAYRTLKGVQHNEENGISNFGTFGSKK